MSVKIDICEPCTYAHDHGWWGDTLPKGAGTHCHTCHESWPGTQTWGHCAACHTMFKSVSAFDRHRTDRCLTADDLTRNSARLRAKGSTHYLELKHHEKLGFDFWGWHRAP